MVTILHWISQTIDESYRNTWEWLHHLDRQQWLVLLAVTTALGFLCMRGFGSRAKH
jgi:hypothetical protein